MGTPGIWWYDRGTLTFNNVGLPNLIRCDRQQFRDVADAEGWRVSRLDRGGGQLVRIQSRLNTVDDIDEIRALQTLDSHLRSGGKISFAGDTGVVFCGATVAPAAPGDTTLVVSTTVLPYGTATLSTGDELLIQTLNPLHYERAVLSADQSLNRFTLTLTLSTGLLREVPEGSVIRQFRTFPALYMDARSATSPERWLSDERYPGRIYEMDLTLVELPYEVSALTSGVGVLGSGTTRLDMGGDSLESVISKGLAQIPERVSYQGTARRDLSSRRGW